VAPNHGRHAATTKAWLSAAMMARADMTARNGARGQSPGALSIARRLHDIIRKAQMHTPVTACLIAVLTGLAPGLAQSGVMLRDGQYDVEVRLELPHVDDLNMRKTRSICVTPGSNREDGSMLTFDIVCEGTNAARASASYALAGDSFRGRITMKMGGKNMTMAETQEGHRVGACPPAAP